MELSKAVVALALVLAVMLVTGYATGAPNETPQTREAARQLAALEHQKRKAQYVRACSKRTMTQAELEACRAAYRRL